MRDLKGKNAIVTGGSKGIGKSVCLTLANAGANVYILDIDKHEGLKTVKEVSELGVETDFCQINVANEIEWIDFSNVLLVFSSFLFLRTFSFSLFSFFFSYSFFPLFFLFFSFFLSFFSLFFPPPCHRKTAPFCWSFRSEGGSEGVLVGL